MMYLPTARNGFYIYNIHPKPGWDDKTYGSNLIQTTKNVWNSH